MSMRTSATIHKERADRSSANLLHYPWVRHDFTWRHVWDSWLAGLPGRNGCNIGYETIDRHLTTRRRDAPALRYLPPRGSTIELTYTQLGEHTGRFANLLAELGVRRHESVIVVGGGIDRIIAILGTLRYGAIAAPVPAGTSGDSLIQQVEKAAGAVLIAGADDYDEYVAPVRDRLPSLRHVFVTGDRRPPAATVVLAGALAAQVPAFTVPPTDPGRPALAHMTASAGPLIHPHRAVAAHYVSSLYALDLHPSDVAWWYGAGPGTLSDTSYGIIAPLVHGATALICDAPFTADSWAATVRRHDVTVCRLGAAELHALRHATAADDVSPPMTSLRLLISDRESPDAAVVQWTARILRHVLHDCWWQPETGAIVVSNFAGMDLRPGSIGLPLPGAEVALIERTAGSDIRFAAPRAVGELAVRADWPGMCDRREGSPGVVRGGWYLSGVRARQDPDGYLWLEDAEPDRPGR